MWLRALRAFAVGAVTAVAVASPCHAVPVLTESFEDDFLDPTLWETSFLGSGPTIAEVNRRLEMAIPGGATLPLGLSAAAEGRLLVSGDFDVRVDFTLLEWPDANGVRIGLATTASPIPGSTYGAVERASDPPWSSLGEFYVIHMAEGVEGIAGTEDLTGTLRLTRVGNVVTGYYLDGATWVEIASAIGNTDPASFALATWSDDSIFTDQDVRVAFDDFTIASGIVVSDLDADGIVDASDNCRATVNPLQADRGGIGAGSGPDGIGDACQCGDVSGDGRVTLGDAVLIQRSLLAPPTATLAHPERCDVGDPGMGPLACSLLDALSIRRALLAPPTATIRQVCAPAQP